MGAPSKYAPRLSEHDYAWLAECRVRNAECGFLLLLADRASPSLQHRKGPRGNRKRSAVLAVVIQPDCSQHKQHRPDVRVDCVQYTYVSTPTKVLNVLISSSTASVSLVIVVLSQSRSQFRQKLRPIWQCEQCAATDCRLWQISLLHQFRASRAR